MTATSGPGISLMAEFIGLAYYAEIPVVIFDIQRVGPSTGLPTRTMQGDILFAATLSHGDTKHPLLLPCSVEECFTMAGTAFDLTEEFQTPVFVMSDLDLGMNYWMSDPFTYSDKPYKRGKVLSKEDLERVQQFARYKDVDGDGVPYRTLPGTPHPLAPYFTRGSGHNERAGYSERPEDYKNNMDRDSARAIMPFSKRATGCASNTACQPTTCVCARIRSMTRFMTSCASISASTWSNKIATAKCSICSSLIWLPIKSASCTACGTMMDCRLRPVPSFAAFSPMKKKHRRQAHSRWKK
jgi:hypothetical protein